eukprot:CAMPEP_0173420484 /NCGR_PEP_ID=MMETSP1357-20121228/1949_1 /TAXON_ID=77926 /ORGANISM="Hemiselmis rufescens, Strain PCC563" /LENGTH=99 /DNA_ID=CAMNT_0014383275 /DNA_START=54 /DNA_END=353 /DNA_ORIENTATION=-
MTGLFGGGRSHPDKPHRDHNPSHPNPYGSPLKAEHSDLDEVFEFVIETMDCSFEWMVPIDIEPGKYVIRIVPTGHDNTTKFGPEDQSRRARESGSITIS